MSLWWKQVLAFLQEISWSVVGLVLLLGGILSYVGDRVGMKFAKKKVSLFGLRPRHTSSLITGLTGALIAFCVMAMLSVFNESVRTALFSMKYLTQQSVQLTAQLQQSRDEKQVAELDLLTAQTRLANVESELNVAKDKLTAAQQGAEQAAQQLSSAKKEKDQLQKKINQQHQELESLQIRQQQLTKQNQELEQRQADLGKQVGDLKQDLTRYQEGNILAVSGERLAQTIIPEGSTKEQVERLIDQLRFEAKAEVARRSHVDVTKVDDGLSQQRKDELVRRCLSIDSRKVIMVTAPSNIVSGDRFEGDYTVYETTLVFRKGEIILTQPIQGPVDDKKAETVVVEMLMGVNRKARKSGMLGDPLTGAVGNMTTAQFYETVKQLKSLKGSAQMVVRAQNDIYSEGPLQITVQIEKQP